MLCTAVVFGLAPRTVLFPCKTVMMLARLVLVKVNLYKANPFISRTSALFLPGGDYNSVHAETKIFTNQP